jgi:hypothetical protein
MAVADVSYLIYDFNQASITPSGGSAVDLDFPNKITPNPETDSFEWKGGGKKIKIESLSGITFDIDLDCIPQKAHSTIFGKAEVTVTGGVNAIGYGGGSDKAGVAVGAKFYANAQKYVADSLVGIVQVVLWVKTGILTLSRPVGLESGSVGAKPQYKLTATAGDKDIAGATITGADEGDYYIIYEVSV